jgi:hypothetical protein
VIYASSRRSLHHLAFGKTELISDCNRVVGVSVPADRLGGWEYWLDGRRLRSNRINEPRVVPD